MTLLFPVQQLNDQNINWHEKESTSLCDYFLSIQLLWKKLQLSLVILDTNGQDLFYFFYLTCKLQWVKCMIHRSSEVKFVVFMQQITTLHSKNFFFYIWCYNTNITATSNRVHHTGNTRLKQQIVQNLVHYQENRISYFTTLITFQQYTIPALMSLL